MKLLYVVLDGLGDLPSPELNGETPLESARTSNMDSLASAGKTGMVYPIKEDVAPESDAAVISILGYDPFRYYTGRGPIEACGAGIKMEDGNIAIRCNFATISEDGTIIDRRVGRNLETEEASQLTQTLNDEVKLTDPPAEFIFKNTVAHRAVLLIKRLDGKLSGKITNTDPAYVKVEGIGVAKKESDKKIEKCHPMFDTEEAKAAANLVNEFTGKSQVILRKHEVNLKRISEGKLPANGILMRDAGDSLPKFPTVTSLYGLNFGCMVEMPVERGIALLCGMKELYLPLSTGDVEKDYIIRAEKTDEALKHLDAVYIHIKGPDEPGHDGQCLRKKENIELIDKYYFGTLLGNINLNEILTAVTADHSTPCTVKSHTADPVPFLVSGGKVKPDKVNRFGEKYCRQGEIGIIRGIEILPTLMKLLKD